MSTMSKVACLFTILRLSLANDVCSIKISRHYGHPSFQGGFFLTFILQVSGLKTPSHLPLIHYTTPLTGYVYLSTNTYVQGLCAGYNCDNTFFYIYILLF